MNACATDVALPPPPPDIAASQRDVILAPEMGAVDVRLAGVLGDLSPFDRVGQAQVVPERTAQVIHLEAAVDGGAVMVVVAVPRSALEDAAFGPVEVSAAALGCTGPVVGAWDYDENASECTVWLERGSSATDIEMSLRATFGSQDQAVEASTTLIF